MTKTMQIPGFKLLSLEDRAVVRKYKEDMTISDMEFTQLYAWQEQFQNQYRIIGDYLCILYRRDDGNFSCYTPFGNYDRDSFQRTLLELKKELDRNGLPFRFDFVPEDWLDRFHGLQGYQMTATCNDDFSDYIYESQDFLNLAGKKNEQKRYLVKYFEKHFSYEYRSLTEENVEDACRVVEKWCLGRDCSQCYWGCEKEAIFRIIRNWSCFDCRGAVIYVDGEPKAFMVGEQISQDMVVSHFQKADKHIKGLYAWLSHEFYVREFPGLRYINLQEDMGVPSLQESKQSYRPCHMLRKYVVSLTERQG